jgi:flagellar hook-length control protein FliK
MAFLPWPVTAPADLRIAAAPLIKAGADPAVAGASAKISRAAMADPESGLTVQVAPLALQPAAAAAPVAATLLVDHDMASPLPADTSDKSATRPQADALIEVATSFTPISRAALPTPVVRSVEVPVHDPRWPQSIAAEVRWCADNGVQSATLKLTPENLGPLEMRVDIKDNQVNVTMTASHAETRQALEQSLPRLRELLSSSGLQLGQANVQQESRRESQLPVSTLRGMLDEHTDDGFVPIRIATGLVDEYA